MSNDRQPEYRFRFSLGRMLILMAAIGAWLASLASVPWPWLVWLASVIFYAAVSLCFSAKSGFEDGDPPISQRDAD